MWERTPVRLQGGFTFAELLTAVAVAAILAGVGVTAVGYWRTEGRRTHTSAQVVFIARALEQYTGRYGALPDLDDPADTERWLALYAAPGPQPRPLPEGVTYTVTRPFVPSTLTAGRVAGEVLLEGTGCEPNDRENSCRLRVEP
jgi:prepilin-type N-terminal cleavage/methylation domain-containing protein